MPIQKQYSKEGKGEMGERKQEKREFKRGGKREFSGGRERRGESHDRHLEFHRADRKNFRKGPSGPHKAKKKRD